MILKNTYRTFYKIIQMKSVQKVVTLHIHRQSIIAFQNRIIQKSQHHIL